MGTRSIVNIYGDDDRPLVTLYRQFDGYPTGMGQDLHDFLKSRVITNGFGPDARWCPVSNGMEDLAAQLIHCLKDDKRADHLPVTGNLYFWPTADGPDEAGMVHDVCRASDGEYCYNIRLKGERLEIAVWEQGNPPALLYRGDPDGMAEAFNLRTDQSVADRMEKEAQDCAGGMWLVDNIPFGVLERAVRAYAESGAGKSFMEFIEDPANPVPELFELQSQILNMYNLRWNGEPKLSAITKAIEDYARYVDPEKAGFRQWFEKETGIDTREAMPDRKASARDRSGMRM